MLQQLMFVGGAGISTSTYTLYKNYVLRHYKYYLCHLPVKSAPQILSAGRYSIPYLLLRISNTFFEEQMSRCVLSVCPCFHRKQLVLQGMGQQNTQVIYIYCTTFVHTYVCVCLCGVLAHVISLSTLTLKFSLYQLNSPPATLHIFRLGGHFWVEERSSLCLCLAQETADSCEKLLANKCTHLQ